MTVFARWIVSEPVRSASDTWKVIVDLLTPDPLCNERKELLAIIGIASSLIAAETIKDLPIIVHGGGPRIKIYGLYGEDAINGENANESQLAENALEGKWSMSLPCLAEDLDWVQKALEKRSTKVTARDVDLDIAEDGKTNPHGNSASVNLEDFLLP